jgi:coproporphyrinogen III oxidase-like Fe-S oxidoreductase
LSKAIDLHLVSLDNKPSVSRLYLGGSKPAYFSDAELMQLMIDFKQYFCAELARFAALKNAGMLAWVFYSHDCNVD